MKKALILSLILVLVLAISACGKLSIGNKLPDGGADKQNGSTIAITRERALEIALEKAGVKQADVHDVDVELDRERGKAVWEVDFDHGNVEYSYDVDAETGDITKAERERDH